MIPIPKSKGLVVLLVAVLLIVVFGGLFQPASLVQTTDWDVNVIVKSPTDEMRYLTSLDFDGNVWNVADKTDEIYFDSIVRTFSEVTPYIDAQSPYSPTTAWLFYNWETTYTLKLGATTLDTTTVNYASDITPADIGNTIILQPVMFDLSLYDIDAGDTIMIEQWHDFDIKDNGIYYLKAQQDFGGRRVLLTVEIDTHDDVEPPIEGTGTYSGYVVDSDGKSIGNALVEIGKLTALTDSSGFWTITEIPVGDYTIEISKTGYGDIDKSVTITEGSDRTWTATMIPTGITPTPSEDTDSDGLPDDWEILYFGDLTQSASTDYDGDGLTNLQEYQAGSNPADSTGGDEYAWTNYGYFAVLCGIIVAAFLFALVPAPPKIKGFLALAIALGGFVVAHLLNTGVI